MKKFVISILFMLMTVPFFSENSKLSAYFNQNFHGNMMGKIITADMKILDDETIDFTANLPAGKKNHIYTYEIIESSENKIVTQWYENGKPDKTVTFTSFEKDNFVMEVKGKGKVKMEKQ